MTAAKETAESTTTSLGTIGTLAADTPPTTTTDEVGTMIITVSAVTIQATAGGLGRRTAMFGMAEDSAMQTGMAAIGEWCSPRGRGPPFAAAGLDEVTPAITTDRKGLPPRGRTATAL